MEIRVTHTLGREQGMQRMLAAAGRLGLELEVQEGAYEGEVRKSSPLGAIQARFSILEAEAVIVITKKPAFLPQDTVRRAIEEGLREELR